MDITCPLCAAKQTERLALTWSKGTSKSKGSSVSLNILGPAVGFLFGIVKAFPAAAPITLFGVVGALPFALAFDFVILALLASLSVGRFWADTQSLLAAETAPPRRFRFWLNLVRGLAFVLVAWVMFFVVADGQDWEPVMRSWIPFEGEKAEGLVLLGIPLVPLVALLVFGLAKGIQYNRHVWPLKEAAWQRTFLCKRCGATFLEPRFDPYGANVVRSDKAGKGKGRLIPHIEPEEVRRAVEAKAAQDARHMRDKAGSDYVNTGAH